MEMKISNDFNKESIIGLLRSVKRKGMLELIDWIQKSDYFDAPASTKYHLSVPGGLAQHHRNVYDFFRAANFQFSLGLDNDSVIIVGLLHDICKCNLYLKSGNSYRCSIDIKNQGHAKRSINMIRSFIDLSDEEEAIIRYHMGTFGIFDYNSNENGEYRPVDIHKAIIRYASVQIFAACDMGSSKFEKCFTK